MRKSSFLLIPFLFLSPLALFAQSSSPDVILQVDPEFFSPNEDGYRDQTFFSPISFTDNEIDRWRLTIRNSRFKKVLRIEGADFSALIDWDGRDKKGRIVPDGKYQAALEVWGRGFKFKTSPAAVFSDTTPPEVVLNVSTNVLAYPEGRGQSLEFNLGAEDENGIDLWQLQILDETVRTVFVEWSSGPVRNVFWDGKDGQTGLFVPKGTYRTAFQAWDKAGNVCDPVFTDVKVDVSAKEMLKRALSRIRVHQNQQGLLVQLPSKSVFEKKEGKVVILESGQGLLRETALLINAYPDVPVQVNGYSRVFGNAIKDRNRGSLWAWSAYSDLVKNGNVKASRMTVEGKGRSADSRRKSLTPDPLTNGVEVLLIGDFEW